MHLPLKLSAQKNHLDALMYKILARFLLWLGFITFVTAISLSFSLAISSLLPAQHVQKNGKSLGHS